MYCKLFTSLYQGTLRGKSDDILVFTNLLAHCDKNGVVDKHWKAISDEVGISENRVKESLKRLESKDPDSRSSEEGGRRILRLDGHRAWGWRVTNYAKYRAMRNEDDRREQNREAQARFKAKARKKEMKSPDKPKVSRGKQGKPGEAHAEADAEASAIPLPPFQGGEREGHVNLIYEAYPRKDAPVQSKEAIRKSLLKIDPGNLLAAVKRYASLPATQREDGRWVPKAKKWFDNEGWLDHLPRKKLVTVEPPMPSKALVDVRLMFARREKMTPEESRLTLAFIKKMTPEDQQFLTVEEGQRIARVRKAMAK